MTGGLLLLGSVMAALLAPLLTPYSPDTQDPLHPMVGPSWHHLLGTDQLGRDVLTRILYGERTALAVGFLSVGLALIFGMLVGVVAGFYSNWADTLLMRVMDVMLAFPLLILAVLLVIVLGPSLTTVIVSVAIALVPQFARVMRASTLSERQREYVESAVSVGASDWRIIRHHIIPNAFPPLFAQATTSIGIAVLYGASLSYLGIGVQPPTSDLGQMVSDFSRLVFTNPLLPLYPGLAIALTALAANLLGDGLAKVLDPRGLRTV
jgi:peptide/nickel transport system permease protein